MSDNDQNDIKRPDQQPEQTPKPCFAAKPHKCPRGKLQCYDWLGDLPGVDRECDIVEVMFKNTRKGFFRNTTNLPLQIGDMVAVESVPGYDVGTVTLTGPLVRKQMRKANVKGATEFRRVYRMARPSDIEKFEESCAKEIDTMIRARKIAESLGLNMKIGDVEYQGDGNKAIFYYIADERVDFRQLIKVLAETFRVRIEMKQIGARQEAGRIGGIGPCGRPLCCSSWMTNFVTVATSAARYQDISLNPQKLAGQCAKLKCCLNFEVDTYVESIKKLPPREITLETADATYFHFKTDIFKREIQYSTDKNQPVNVLTITAERAFEIITLNKQGQKPLSLLPDGEIKEIDRRGAHDILGDADLTRFDKKKKKKGKGPKPQGQKPQGDNPNGPKPQGQKPQGDNPNAPKPQGQKPQGPRPQKRHKPDRNPGDGKPNDGKPNDNNQ